MPAFLTGAFWDLANAQFWVGAGLVVFFGILVLVKVPAAIAAPSALAQVTHYVLPFLFSGKVVKKRLPIPLRMDHRCTRGQMTFVRGTKWPRHRQTPRLWPFRRWAGWP